jgi:hypothetical protein
MTTISTLLGFFNICAGIMLTAALLLFIGGFIRYLILLGTERRNLGLVLMFWGMTILFVLVVLLAIIDVLQGAFAFLLGIAIALLICFAIVIGLAKIKPDGGAPAEH